MEVEGGGGSPELVWSRSNVVYLLCSQRSREGAKVTRSKIVAAIYVFFIAGSAALASKAFSNGDVILGVIAVIFFCAVCALAVRRQVFKDYLPWR